jgi:carbon catabolite-derepressing protein kinase
MLVVDPVKRITVAEIRQLPWFQQNLPHYLQPLPPTPAAEPFGFGFRQSKANGGEGEQVEGEESNDEHQDIGTVDDEIMAELADKMAGFSVDELKQRLMEKEDNQVKVAYHLVRDHKRMLQTSHLDESKEMEGFLAQDPPAWNAGLDGGISRSTSIRRRVREGGRSRTRSGAIQRGLGVTEAAEAIVGDESTTSEMEGGNATDEVATEGFGSDDEDGISVTDEDETGLFTEDDELDESSQSHAINVAVLKSSIYGGRTDETPMSEAAPPIAVTSSSRRSRNRWHFGIRSRSPPMEIMLELYRTLQVLGMEWRAKPQDEKVKGEGDKDKEASNGRHEAKDNQDDQSGPAEDLFFIETRWKVDNIIARMNLQLYRVDETNYLVDFRNVGYVRMNTTKDGELDSNVASPLDLDGQNGFSADQTTGNSAAGIHEALEKAQRKGDQDASSSATTAATAAAAVKATQHATHQSSQANAAEGRKEVCSPFLFLECATRLIVELAGGSG